MDIQQGNVVTSKMMLQLRPGMSKSQVRFIMGTPLIQDSFHSNRWDYFYQMRKAGKIIEQRRVILDFENEALARVRGDVIPAGSDPTQTDVAPTAESTKPTSQASSKKPEKKKGLIDSLMFWKGDEAEKKPESAPADLVNPQPKQTVPAKPQPVKPAAAPAKPEAAPVQQSQPAQEPPAESKAEVKPMPAPAEPAAVPESAPAPSAKPQEPAAAEPTMAEPAPAPSQPATKPTAKTESAAKPQAPAKPAAKPAKPEPEPEADLPPEDEPGYFERMLEKIGF